MKSESPVKSRLKNQIIWPHMLDSVDFDFKCPGINRVKKSNRLIKALGADCITLPVKHYTIIL